VRITTIDYLVPTAVLGSASGARLEAKYGVFEQEGQVTTARFAMDMDALIARAKQGHREAIGQLILACHGPLMKVWNRFRDQMYDREIMTDAALNDVESLICEKISTFNGTSVGEFCKWSRTIFCNMILQRLRGNRPPPPGPLQIDPIGGDTPSAEARARCDEIKNQ
jgi:hypothetical protein